MQHPLDLLTGALTWSRDQPYRRTTDELFASKSSHDLLCRFEPGEPSSGFTFVSEIKGGAVPKEYIPGVVKVIFIPLAAVALCAIQEINDASVTDDCHFRLVMVSTSCQKFCTLPVSRDRGDDSTACQGSLFTLCETLNLNRTLTLTPKTTMNQTKPQPNRDPNFHSNPYLLSNTCRGWRR